MHWFLTILWISVFQGLLILGVLIQRRWYRKSGGKALLALLVLVLTGLGLRLGYSPQVYMKYPLWVQAGDGVIPLFGPVFWWYSKEVIDSKNLRLRFQHLLHAVPFFIFLLHFVVVLLPIPASKFVLVEQAGTFNLYYNILLIGGILLNTIYLTLTLKHLRKPTRITGLVRLLKVIVLCNLLACVLWAMGHALSMVYINFGYLTNLIYQLAFIAFSLSTFVLSIGAMLNGDLLLKEEPVKYNSSSLSNIEIYKIGRKLEDIMESEKPYLNTKLSLEQLANSLDINRVYLSRVINEAFQMSFFDLINQYRIEEFIHRVHSGEFEHLTLFGIASDSGFNTKATFNKAFKKRKGLTPSQFFAQSVIPQKQYTT